MEQHDAHVWRWRAHHMLERMLFARCGINLHITN